MYSATATATATAIAIQDSIKSDKDHTDFILHLIHNFETLDRKTRVKNCIILYDYLLNALDFLKKHTTFTEIVIKKAYHIKSNAGDVPEIVQSIDNFLRAFGAPLHKTVDCCDSSDEHYESQQAHREHLARSLLMQKLFAKEKLVFTPDIMDIYYNSEVQTVRVNRYEKMMLFINAYKNIDDETNYL